MKLCYLFLALLLVGTATALQELSTERGETLVIVSKTSYRGPLYDISADYNIPEIGFHYMTVDTNPTSSTVEQPLAIDAPAGTYLMTVTIKINREVALYEKILVTITDEEQERTQQTQRTQTNETQTTSAITIPPIPDVTPGTTLVLPVRITGNGTYQLELDRLTFATYEVPEPVQVKNSASTSVLLHINDDAKPGTYTVTMRAGDQNATTRVRVIKYVEHKEPVNWYLIAGVALVLLGLILLFTLTRKKPGKPTHHEPSNDDDDEKLITYY